MLANHFTKFAVSRAVFSGARTIGKVKNNQLHNHLLFTIRPLSSSDERTTSDIEGFQGAHEFAAQRAKEIQNDIAEREESLKGDDSKIGKENVVANEDSAEEAEAYNLQTQGISLHSCMQSQVPEPYQPDSTAPTHLNMPGGGVNQSQKYVSENQTSNHPYRKFSTVAIRHQESIAVNAGDVRDSEAFRVWLKRCENLGLSQCDEALENLRSGRTTLKELFETQEAELKKIAANYQRALSNSSVQGVQSCNMGDNLTALMKDGRISQSPQGIQGENAELFKIWLLNCGRFGFSSCDDLLQDFQSGKKTLAELFEHQDEEIRRAAEEFRTKNNASEPEEVQLTQRQKFQRAIKDYGSTVVIFHVGISLMSLGGFYTLVYSGVDVVGILAKLGVGQSILESRLAAGASTFIVAYAVHKVFAPVRIAITLTCTPFIVRYLRRVGFLKSPKLKK